MAGRVAFLREQDAPEQRIDSSSGARQTDRIEVFETVGQHGSPGSDSLKARTVARATSPHHARQGHRGTGRPGRKGTRMSGDVFVGIDVAKETVEVAVRPSGERWEEGNDEKGRKTLVQRLRDLSPALVVMEATGGYEAELALALTGASISVRVLNPRQVRDFAKGKGLLAKTDGLDAAILAEYAETYRPEPRALPEEEAREMAALLSRRRQLVEMRVAEGNRLEQARGEVRKRILAHVAWLESEIERTESNLDQRIRKSPLYLGKHEMLTSVPGVGERPRTRRARPKGDRGPGRRRAFQPRQRKVPRQEKHLGRAGTGPRRALHGRRRGLSSQRRHPHFLRKAPCCGQAKEARAHGMHEEAPHDPQRHDTNPLALGPGARGS